MLDVLDARGSGVPWDGPLDTVPFDGTVWGANMLEVAGGIILGVVGLLLIALVVGLLVQIADRR